MVDTQLDPLQQAVVKPDFDPLDVPHDRFLVAGRAWQLVRSGKADPESFGIGDMWGQWYIIGNLTLDIMALQNIELATPRNHEITKRKTDGWLWWRAGLQSRLCGGPSRAAVQIH